MVCEIFLKNMLSSIIFINFLNQLSFILFSRLLRVREPHGIIDVTWKGDWNAKSKLWDSIDQDASQTLKKDAACENSCWMSFTDFLRYFAVHASLHRIGKTLQLLIFDMEVSLQLIEILNIRVECSCIF